MKTGRAAMFWALSTVLFASGTAIIAASSTQILPALYRLHGDVLPRELFPSTEDSYRKPTSLVTFAAHGDSSSLFLTPEIAILEFKRKNKGVDFQDVSMQIVHADFTPVVGEEQPSDNGSYFVGNYLEQGASNVRPCARSHQRDILPGIDLIFYPDTTHFQFDFIVEPGADPQAIELEFVHIDYKQIDNFGNLTLNAGGLAVFEHAPVIYQESEGTRKPIVGGFAIVNDGLDIGFRVEDYEKGLPLIISVR